MSVTVRRQGVAARQPALGGASPEQVQVALLHMGQRLQGGLVQPAALDQHLHQVAHADGRHQPALVGSNVQHRLGNQKRVSTSVCVCVCGILSPGATWQMRMALSSTVLVSVV